MRWPDRRVAEDFFMSAPYQELLHRIAACRSRIGIIGLGYVGLPLARAFVLRGFSVLGFDTDSVKVARLASGKSYIRSVPDAVVRVMYQKGFEATDRLDRLSEADVLILCLPTPLSPSRDPDLGAVVTSAEAVALCLRPGQLVV